MREYLISFLDSIQKEYRMNLASMSPKDIVDEYLKKAGKAKTTGLKVFKKK